MKIVYATSCGHGAEIDPVELPVGHFPFRGDPPPCGCPNQHVTDVRPVSTTPARLYEWGVR